VNKDNQKVRKQTTGSRADIYAKASDVQNSIFKIVFYFENTK